MQNMGSFTATLLTCITAWMKDGEMGLEEKQQIK
jgi:hypothetical protein